MYRRFMDSSSVDYSVLEKKVAMDILGWEWDEKMGTLSTPAKGGGRILTHVTNLRLFSSKERVFDIQRNMQQKFNLDMYLFPKYVVFRNMIGSVHVLQKINDPEHITRAVAYAALKAIMEADKLAK